MATKDSLFIMKELEASRNREDMAKNQDANFELLANEVDKKTDVPVNDTEFASLEQVYTDIVDGAGITKVEEILEDGSKRVTLSLTQFETTEILNRQLGDDINVPAIPAGVYTLPKVKSPETDDDTEEDLFYIKGLNNINVFSDGLMLVRGEQWVENQNVANGGSSNLIEFLIDVEVNSDLSFEITGAVDVDGIVPVLIKHGADIAILQEEVENIKVALETESANNNVFKTVETNTLETDGEEIIENITYKILKEEVLFSSLFGTVDIIANDTTNLLIILPNIDVWGGGGNPSLTPLTKIKKGTYNFNIKLKFPIGFNNKVTIKRIDLEPADYFIMDINADKNSMNLYVTFDFTDTNPLNHTITYGISDSVPFNQGFDYSAVSFDGAYGIDFFNTISYDNRNIWDSDPAGSTTDASDVRYLGVNDIVSLTLLVSFTKIASPGNNFDNIVMYGIQKSSDNGTTWTTIDASVTISESIQQAGTFNFRKTILVEAETNDMFRVIDLVGTSTPAVITVNDILFSGNKRIGG